MIRKPTILSCGLHGIAEKLELLANELLGDAQPASAGVRLIGQLKSEAADIRLLADTAPETDAPLRGSRAEFSGAVGRSLVVLCRALYACIERSDDSRVATLQQIVVLVQQFEFLSPRCFGCGISSSMCNECGMVVAAGALSPATDRDLCASCARVQCALDYHNDREDALAEFTESSDERTRAAFEPLF